MKIQSFFLLALFAWATNLLSGTIDTELKKAREIVSKETIKCSAEEGNADAPSPLFALKKLKKGSELVFLPGNYGEVSINQDGIIISGDGTGFVDIQLKINGKKCIVRNLWANSLLIGTDTTVVDSVIGWLSIDTASSYDSHQNIKVSIYNTAFCNLATGYDDRANVDIKNCTAIKAGFYRQSLTGQVGFRRWDCGMENSGSVIECDPFSNITIINSILVSPSHIFNFDKSYHNDKAKLSLKNNIIYGKNGLAIMGCDSRAGTAKDKTGTVALEFKEMKKMGSVSISSDNMMEIPKFKSNNSNTGISDLSIFVPTDDYQTKGRGIIIDENPYFKEFRKEKSDAPPKDAPPEKDKPETKPKEEEEDKDEPAPKPMDDGAGDGEKTNKEEDDFF
jgi:hypothetical protein